MRFVWFWTFWHWSKESFRSGTLLRGPLEGIGGHWDEWFQHEASEEDREAIEEIRQSEPLQREFVAWIFRHWACEADFFQRNHLVPRFVLGQLAHAPPFNRWHAFAEYRDGYGVGGISAIVLEEGSAGAAEDVRTVEAIALPALAQTKSGNVIPEGFSSQSQAAELEAPRQAAMSLLSGKAFLSFCALWIIGGRRPYPRWLAIALRVGWITVAAIIIRLLLGPDLGERLPAVVGGLSILWIGLIAIAFGVAATQTWKAWHTGRKWRSFLEESQLRLRMNGGLTLKGASAGLPFLLNTLLALYRAYPPAAGRSWLWRRFFHNLHADASSWAATGVIMPSGRLKPVVLDAKLRACLLDSEIKRILTPRQRDASKHVVARIAETIAPAGMREAQPDVVSARRVRLGFAAEHDHLHTHPCRHVAQCMMAVGKFASGVQLTTALFALLVSAVMVTALGDLRAILLPPPPPAVVAPSSPSPYYLWVSLDTTQPRYFQVVLESDFWANRQAPVEFHGGANASTRAEIRLHRHGRQTSFKVSPDDGTVWIERRRHFLGRELGPGERVGCYSLAYFSEIGYE